MKTIVQLEMTLTGFKKLRHYLIRHEDDIAIDINDFGDLRGLFTAVFDDYAHASEDYEKEGKQLLDDGVTDDKQSEND